jgi:hypothetical protein
MAILSCPMENGQTSKFFAGNIDGLEFADFFLSAAAALRSSASE